MDAESKIGARILLQVVECASDCRLRVTSGASYVGPSEARLNGRDHPSLSLVLEGSSCIARKFLHSAKNCSCAFLAVGGKRPASLDLCI